MPPKTIRTAEDLTSKEVLAAAEAFNKLPNIALCEIPGIVGHWYLEGRGAREKFISDVKQRVPAATKAVQGKIGKTISE